MSPLVFSLTVCGGLLGFCRWVPWEPPLWRHSHTCGPTCVWSVAWNAFISGGGGAGGLGPPPSSTLRAISGRGGVGGLGPPSPDYTSRGRLSLVCGAWPCMPDRWVRRCGTQPRRKLRCLFGRWPREDLRAEKAATSEPLRCGLWTGLREERLFRPGFWEREISRPRPVPWRGRCSLARIPWHMSL